MKTIIVSLLFVPSLLFAQDNSPDMSKQKTFGLGFVPQYAISNGFRIDLDFRLNNKNHWLTVAPQMYLSSKPNLNWDYNSMTGAGLELQHKIFLQQELKDINPYFSYGPVFNYFSVKEDGLVANEFIENGNQYIGLEENEIINRIYKFGGNLIFGLHFIIMNNFYLDGYIGTGIRFSFDDQTNGLHNYYNDWWGDMGYSGTLIVGGIRFGVLF